MPQREDSASSSDSSGGESRTSSRSEWLKTLPALIAAITALITAIAALRKPPDTTAPKATYEELSRLINELKDASDQNHEDIVGLRNFLDGYIRARDGARGDLFAAGQPRGLGVGSAVGSVGHGSGNAYPGGRRKDAEPAGPDANADGKRGEQEAGKVGRARADKPSGGQPPPAGAAAPSQPAPANARDPSLLPNIGAYQAAKRPRPWIQVMQEAQKEAQQPGW